jgi:transcriptional regulator with XRE-family HTH domain
MLKALGEELKRGRDQGERSLQAVAEPAKITAPYLQKLERGAVETPSPRVLARLAKVLGLSYLRLMELAGYLDEEQLAEIRLRAPMPHPLADHQLSPEEWRAVGAFIRELKAHATKRRRPARGP